MQLDKSRGILEAGGINWELEVARDPCPVRGVTLGWMGPAPAPAPVGMGRDEGVRMLGAVAVCCCQANRDRWLVASQRVQSQPGFSRGALGLEGVAVENWCVKAKPVAFLQHPPAALPYAPPPSAKGGQAAKPNWSRGDGGGSPPRQFKLKVGDCSRRRYLPL